MYACGLYVCEQHDVIGSALPLLHGSVSSPLPQLPLSTLLPAGIESTCSALPIQQHLTGGTEKGISTQYSCSQGPALNVTQKLQH